MNYLFFIGIILIFINIVCAEKEDNIKNEEEYYLIFVKHNYDEFKVYSDTKHEKREESQIFIESFMDQINDLIIENIDTYKYPENLEVLDETSKLRKRNNGQSLFFTSNSEYIYPISSIENTVVLYTYLSNVLVKKIESFDNVKGCYSSKKHKITLSTYYNKKDILNETHWSDLKIQENADLHLSLLSQGKFDKKKVNKYDNNYYYPSSGGKDINIVIMDSGFNFNYSEFTNDKKRTVKCAAIVEKGHGSTENIEKNCGPLTTTHGRIVSDMAGGYLHGTAKNANIYGVSIPADKNDTVDDSDILGGLQFIYENLVKPYKTIINLSFAAQVFEDDPYTYQLKKIINSIVNKGGIVVACAGNEYAYLQNRYYTYFPCEFENVICIGGYDSISSDDDNLYTFNINYSNYGPSVDVYAPYNVKARILNTNNKEENVNDKGTSFSSPLVAGMIAVYMSEHPNTQYTTDTIRKYLKENGATEVIETPKKGTGILANNGKHIVYSSNEIYNGCGIYAGNRKCNNNESLPSKATTTKKTTTTTKKTTTTTKNVTTTVKKVTKKVVKVVTIKKNANK